MHRPWGRLRWQASSYGRPDTVRYSRGSRLAGERARKPCTVHGNAFAGKPAPTVALTPRDIPVGAGLPAKGPASLAPSMATPSLASQLLRSP
ncbi:hypothetical protein C5U62_00900 [Pseudomonas protegens]|uniref:Uncharacterized protein n=1 Tax=Pseudomonas protegens TaxID=380021 RepID=A0A2T6GR07_9PSED|nr:hypothetical protein C5U62_00900 [Pseudomonas protegens]